MKCVSARTDGHDRDDIAFLISFLKIKSDKHVFDLITKYYPIARIPPQAKFLVQELIQEKRKQRWN